MKGKLKNKRRKALYASLSGLAKESKTLQSYYFQNGKWHKVGPILK